MDEWEVRRAPFAMLDYVAGADSLVDRAEWESLVRALMSGIGSDDPVVGSLIEDLSDELAAPPSAEPERALEDLPAAARFSAGAGDEGAQVGEALLSLGQAVADGSGAKLTRSFFVRPGKAAWNRSDGTSAVEHNAESAAAGLGLS